MSETPDTVVVGGGIIGCMTAYRLAERTERTVTVLERKQISAEASGLSAGLISPSLYLDRWPDAAHLSYDFFEAFDGTGTFEFTRRDRLDFCRPDEKSAYCDRADRLSELGFSVEFLSAEEIETEYPSFDMDGFAGGNRYHDAGWVDPYSLTVTLKDEDADRGVEFRTGIAVEGLETEDGQVVGVKTGGGTIPSDSVVVAAGWRTGDLLEDVVSLPIRPYKTPCVTLNPPEPLDEQFPLGRFADERYLYFRPEHNGNLLVGNGENSVEAPEKASTGTDIDPEFERYLARKLPELFEDGGEMELVHSWAGVDGATPDGRAIIDGPGLDLDGLVIASGFNGLGVVCSPIAGELVHAFVTDTDPAIRSEPFQLSRFDDVDAEFEFDALHHNQ